MRFIRITFGRLNFASQLDPFGLLVSALSGCPLYCCVPVVELLIGCVMFIEPLTVFGMLPFVPLSGVCVTGAVDVVPHGMAAAVWLFFDVAVFTPVLPFGEFVVAVLVPLVVVGVVAGVVDVPVVEGVVGAQVAVGGLVVLVPFVCVVVVWAMAGRLRLAAISADAAMPKSVARELMGASTPR